MSIDLFRLKLPFGLLISVSGILLFNACTSEIAMRQTASTNATDTTTTITTTTTTSSIKAAKIIFRQSNPSGSFDASAANGTTNALGSGQQAVRVFNADGSLLADGGLSDANWPKWLKSVEISMSGSNNTAATNADCARFANSTDTNAVCDFDEDGTFDQNCGAPDGLYRISERDCSATGSTISDGSGSSTDGVYIMAELDRDTNYIGSDENILVILEYAASVINPAPADPTQCFSNGVFDPTSTNCSDMSWQIFLKHSTAEAVQPYLLLVPPALGSVDKTNNRGGSGVATKQFFIPLAGDSTLSVLQISRIKAIGESSLSSICSTNSASCVGMIFYSITFFRI